MADNNEPIQTTEEKAAEARRILEEELKALRADFGERLQQSREETALDRAQGQQRAAEIFSPGVLGRISEDVPDDIVGMLLGRELQLGEAIGTQASEQDLRKAELERVTKEFDALQQEAADPNSARARAAREQAELQVDRQLRTNLGRISGLSNAAQTGMNRALVGDALQAAIQQRGEYAREQAIQNQQARERLALEGAALRGEGIAGIERLTRAQREEEAGLRRQLEELRGAIRQDVQNRQIFNLQQRSAELFGGLGVEESMVQQGISERAGIRAQQLAETQSAESIRHQRESERIQEIEARKDPPSGGGGGKSILCVQYWLTGDLSDDVLRADFLHTMRSADLDDNVRLAYYTWSGWIAPHILKKGLIYRCFKPFVMAWAHQMAATEGVAGGYKSPLGWAMRYIGAPIHRAAGWVLSKFGYTVEAAESSERVEELFQQAKHLWDQAEWVAGTEEAM